MRFQIILFISSLLVLTFAADPSPPPLHGDTVRYQGTHGPRPALVVGLPDRDGKHNLAPFRTDYNVQHGERRIRTNHIVKAHPNDIVGVPNRPSRSKLASAIASGHGRYPPSVSDAKGSVFGSKNYRDAAPPLPSNTAGLRNGKGYHST